MGEAAIPRSVVHNQGRHKHSGALGKAQICRAKAAPNRPLSLSIHLVYSVCLWESELKHTLDYSVCLWGSELKHTLVYSVCLWGSELKHTLGYSVCLWESELKHTLVYSVCLWGSELKHTLVYSSVLALTRPTSSPLSLEDYCAYDKYYAR